MRIFLSTLRRTFSKAEVRRSREFLRLERIDAGDDCGASDLALRLVRLLRRELERSADDVPPAANGGSAVPLARLVHLIDGPFISPP